MAIFYLDKVEILNKVIRIRVMVLWRTGNPNRPIEKLSACVYKERARRSENTWAFSEL